ncbi:hypothetical protein [Amycolatopsis minnesotensis]|uniref:Tail terminator n=1 Tax=Amycolatopsis minnesotensis TaxID=337894 RepID=A0ABP5CDW5_9PSEU
MTDAEALVVVWLAGRLGGIRVVAELPAKFEQSLPVVQVTGLPGPKTDRPWNAHGPLLWHPRIDIDTYAATRAIATDLASTVSGHLHELAGQGNQWGAVVDVGEPAGPAWRPDYNPSVRRAGLTVELTIRAG